LKERITKKRLRERTGLSGCLERGHYLSLSHVRVLEKTGAEAAKGKERKGGMALHVRLQSSA